MTKKTEAMSDIRFVFTGEASAVEQAAVAFEAALGGSGTGVRRIEREQLPDAVRRVVDPISLAALILAVPVAIVAALDIADRIRGKRKRAAELVQTAQRMRVEQHVEIFVLAADGASHALADLNADKVLDIAEPIVRIEP